MFQEAEFEGAVCREHLRAAEAKAMEDQERAKKRFREWVRTKVPDAEYMNICSGPQVCLVATLYRSSNMSCCHKVLFAA